MPIVKYNPFESELEGFPGLRCFRIPFRVVQ